MNLNVGWIVGLCGLLATGLLAAADPAAVEATSAPACQATTAPSTQPAAGAQPTGEADPIGCWFGLLPKLTNAGIKPTVTYIMDSSDVFQGGLRRHHWAVRYLLTVGLDANLQTLANLKGGDLYASFADHHGRDGSGLVGESQRYSTIDGTAFDELYEIWYRQKLLDDKVQVKIGKIDTNTDFDVVDDGVEFLNSSMGYSPTILNFPTYSSPAFGAEVLTTPTEWLYANVGIFDGSAADGVNTGTRGPKTFFTESQKFLIGEAGLKWKLGPEALPGRLGVGVWSDTGEQTRLDRSRQEGTAGPYAVLDQALWRPDGAKDDDPRRLGMFLQYGWADERVSEFREHFGGGLAWTGLIPHREADVLGAGVTTALLSEAADAGFAHGEETSFETFYKIVLTPWMALKPDFQYIQDPGGRGGDALVGTLRLVLSW